MNKAISIILLQLLADSTIASDVEPEVDGFKSSQLFKLPSFALIERTADKLTYEYIIEDYGISKNENQVYITSKSEKYLLKGTELTFPALDPIPGTSPAMDITLTLAMKYEEFKNNLNKLDQLAYVTVIVTDESDPKIPELVEAASVTLNASEQVVYAPSNTLVQPEVEETPAELEIGVEDYKAALKSCHPCGAFKYVGRFFTWMTTRAKQD